MADYGEIVAELRKNFYRGKMQDLDSRREQLSQLAKMLEENSDDFCEAIYKDLHRSKAEMFLLELILIKNEIQYALENLDSWTTPQPAARSLLFMTSSAYVVKDPLGVVLIISPWNYPLYLLLMPFIGALAAGNCTLLKPSEISVHTTELLMKLVPKYMDPDVVRIVNGGPADTANLLKARFDHVFFTGSTHVGRLIMKAAAEHLTPVTLELGGKSPVIVDEDIDLRISAKRITWGKFMSAGQTCVAPDYVLCHENQLSEFVKYVGESIEEFYGEDPQKATDFCRIINRNHYERLHNMIKSTNGEVLIGGKRLVADELYIEPTVVKLERPDDILMESEIFGPVMIIMSYKTFDEALEFIRQREKPLSMYLFSHNQQHIDAALSSISCGGVTINDVILHITLNTLPFGGVGMSGTGRCHGKFSFDAFTHEKSVLHRPIGMEKFLFMRYPPYNDRKFYWAQKAMTPHSWKSMCTLM